MKLTPELGGDWLPGFGEILFGIIIGAQSGVRNLVCHGLSRGRKLESRLQEAKSKLKQGYEGALENGGDPLLQRLQPAPAGRQVHGIQSGDSGIQVLSHQSWTPTGRVHPLC